MDNLKNVTNMEEIIKQLKEKLSNESYSQNRIIIKECIYIAENIYIKSLTPDKAIEVINQYKKEL